MDFLQAVISQGTPHKSITAPSGIVWVHYPHSENSNEGCSSYCADGDGMTAVCCWDGVREEYNFETETSAVHARGNFLRTDAGGEVMRLSDDINEAIVQADAYMRENELFTWMYLDGAGRFALEVKRDGVVLGRGHLDIQGNTWSMCDDTRGLKSAAGRGAFDALARHIEKGLFDGKLAGKFRLVAGRFEWLAQYRGPAASGAEAA